MFLTKLGVDGFQILPMQLEVDMEDGSTFKGVITRFDSSSVPYWMQPSQNSGSRYFAFIRTPRKLHFVSTLISIDLIHLDPAYHVPKKAELRIKIKEDDEQFLATSFQPFPIEEEIRDDFGNLPPENRIYIIRPGGPIFSAVLECQLKAGEIRKLFDLSLGTSSREYPSKRRKMGKN